MGDQKWVDIGAPKKDGKYQPCGRKSAKGSKRKYQTYMRNTRDKKKIAAVRKMRKPAKGGTTAD